jgi:hypothetical protein
MFRTWLSFSALLFIPAAPVFGWGCEGHQMVALIARAHLTPAAAAAVDRLLTENPTDPALRQFCKDKTGDAMADTASWADDIKGPEKTGVWHYVDIPLTEQGGGSLAAWCPPIGPSVDGKDRPGCVTNAIEYEWSILLDTARSGRDRATALRYLIHFVGDMHQPLHSSDNDDHGGNCTAIRFYDEDRPANLHSIWDYKLIQHQLTAKKETPVEYARSLDRQYADRWAAWGTGVVDPTGWAWEGNKIARGVTYGDLKPAIPVEQPNPQADCNAERDKVAGLHIVVGDAYFAESMPVIGEQLAKAGYRLADLLNRTF